jgi:hypothetical protein
MGHLLDALARGYDMFGFAAATGRDEVFRAPVLARIIEPTSKLDALRVLDRSLAFYTAVGYELDATVVVGSAPTRSADDAAAAR